MPDSEEWQPATADGVDTNRWVVKRCVSGHRFALGVREDAHAIEIERDTWCPVCQCVVDDNSKSELERAVDAAELGRLVAETQQRVAETKQRVAERRAEFERRRASGYKAHVSRLKNETNKEND